MPDNDSSEAGTKGWSRILAATGSPLKLFALTVLVCNAVFGVAAAAMGNIEAFKYSIHMFLGIVAAFVLTALWSPRSLYHPTELLDLHDRKGGDEYYPAERPLVPTVLIVAGAVLYTIYQIAPFLLGLG